MIEDIREVLVKKKSLSLSGLSGLLRETELHMYLLLETLLHLICSVIFYGRRACLSYLIWWLRGGPSDRVFAVFSLEVGPSN